jgi:hypothetical protein
MNDSGMIMAGWSKPTAQDSARATSEAGGRRDPRTLWAAAESPVGPRSGIMVDAEWEPFLLEHPARVSSDGKHVYVEIDDRHIPLERLILHCHEPNMVIEFLDGSDHFNFCKSNLRARPARRITK